MLINDERIRELLQGFDFKALFIEELGWDRYTTTLDVSIDGQNYTLSAIAEKRGMVVFVCEPFIDEGTPDYQTRRKIDRQVAKAHHEHLIIYLDADKSMQIWQWVKRQAGKPAACREHAYYITQPGDALIQKIGHLVFSLEEEEDLTIVEVGRRARTSFDVEKITKRFYDRFETEHGKFMKFLKGIPEEKFQRWYVSVMLNRLMFIYFIQKKGFLGNDTNYLRSRLEQSKERGMGQYYKSFLCSLFFEGFAKKEDERSPEINQLLDKVPYLDGGLFQQHQVEKLYGKEIQIADTAFDNLFAFFEQYQWYLDERPLRADNEINPDVLGYIFEKYVNQKQMGAYYTKEDITGYISKNTIIPFLFDQAKKKCRIAFEGEQAVWRLLKEDPDRYIYDAVKKGVKLFLPEEVEVGIEDVSKRTEWNNAAPEEYALPTEIWREVVARRQRYEEVSDKMLNGEISSINDLITYNLDIRQFAHDVIENCEGPELLRAIYYTIGGRIPDKSNQEFQPGISVLDPTCGSGAFLFAALNILEPLYEACLDRMQLFLDELDSSDQKHRSDKFGDFQKILERIEEHPNRRYFILKSIILNNLYGVDIMEEAIEICKLRLFLKLVAQIDKIEDIEPLPDIDFNIRAGNTLVGFASHDEVKEAITTAEAGKQKQGKILFGEYVDILRQIEESAEIADRAFKKFQEMQTARGMDMKHFANAKQDLRRRLKELGDELDCYLASGYEINQNVISSEKKYEKMFTQWHESHQPFHWFSEFYGIMKQGGFGVIIGNPPYVEYSKVKNEYTIKGFTTERCANLYAYIIERCFDILRVGGRFSMIVQLPIVCTDRMVNLQKECLDNSFLLWFANFDDRPARLFDGLEHIRATILISKKSRDRIQDIFSTTYNRWYSEDRPLLFDLLSFARISGFLMKGAIQKIGHPIAISIMDRIRSFRSLNNYLTKYSSNIVYFHNAPQYWIRSMDFAPYFWNEREGEQISTHMKTLYLENELDAPVLTAILNSSLFYFWFIIHSNCRDLVMREIENFPIDIKEMPLETKRKLTDVARVLMIDLAKNAQRKECYYKTTGRVKYDEFFPKHSKPIIDQIDRLLSKYYGFTDEELDFIINYDIKYRMGLS